MTDKERQMPLPHSLSQSIYQTQEETLVIARKPNKMSIGLPKENTFQENRVALVPSSVANLVAHGHRVVIEAGAGKKSNFADIEYAEAGGEIVYDRESVFQAGVILKVAPPTLDEIALFHPNQIIISPLHLPTVNPNYIDALLKKRVIALAMEYIKDEAGSFPLVRIISEMAGISAILTAAKLLTKTGGGDGILLGGISGIAPSKVVILGAGVVAEFATRAALGLGAEVRVFDDNVYKLMRLKNQVGRQIFTSTINPHSLGQELRQADVAIGAIHSELGRTPCIVSEEMVSTMKQGAVIVDVSIDQGGCFETSEITTHDRPTFVKYGVIHYCVPNITSNVCRTASAAFSNILTPLLLKTEQSCGMESLIYDQIGLRHGVYVYKGCLTNNYLGEKFKLRSMDLNLLLSSHL